jgi:quercetin dioxygenase-like cupin family protein
MQPSLPASSTSSFPYLEAHFSRLPYRHKTSPHIPHSHFDEEVMVVLNGSLRLAYSSLPTNQLAPMDAGSKHDISVIPTSTSTVYDGPRGTIAVHSAQNNHSIAAIDGAPVFYLCFRFIGARIVERMATQHTPMQLRSGRLARTMILSPSSRVLKLWTAAERGTEFAPLRSRKTETILESVVLSGGEVLHIHATLTPPGAGYAPHEDTYDVLLLTLAGSIEITGSNPQRLGPYSLALLPAGSTHGLQNVGSTPSVHYTFELRAQARAAGEY